MRSLDTRQRIVDKWAIGPAQFNIDQRSFIDGMQRSRGAPGPVEITASTTAQDPDTGDCVYSDLLPDDDAFAMPPVTIPNLWGTYRP